jgi:predicted ATPase
VFPRLKTRHETNLPVPTTSFVGRTGELTAVTELLARNDARLVTLTGVVAPVRRGWRWRQRRRAPIGYPAGVWWVPLASLRDPRLFLDQASQALGVQGDLVEQLTDRRLLILFDNFEHLVEAASDLGHPCVAVQTCANS